MARSRRVATTGTAPPRPPGKRLAGDQARQGFLGAVRHFNVGDLNGATRLLQAILDARPSEPDALHLLGVITAQRGAPDEGAALIARALSLPPPTTTRHKII